MKSKKSQILLNLSDVLNTYKSEKHGKEALSKYASWFPLRPSIELAGITADLMGDGHIQKGDKLRLDYTSKSLEELERFGRELYSIFKVNGKVRRCVTNK